MLQRNRHSIPRCRYLTELGIPPEKLPSMLRKQPQILQFSQKGLMPRVAYFKKELLIPEAEIPKMLERNPAVLTFSVENQIKPRVDFLKDLGISHDGVVKMIVRHPHLLQYSFEGLEEHINFLTSIGMDEQDVVHTVTRPRSLSSASRTRSGRSLSTSRMRSAGITRRASSFPRTSPSASISASDPGTPTCRAISAPQTRFR